MTERNLSLKTNFLTLNDVWASDEKIEMKLYAIYQNRHS